MNGGYNKIDENDKIDISGIVNFILQELSKQSNSIKPVVPKLQKVVSAETQVVAGMNYRIRFVVDSHGDQVLTAVVFQDLQGNLSLTSLK